MGRRRRRRRGVPYDARYHAARDGLGNVDVNATALDIGVDVIAYTLGRYARSLPEPDSPAPARR
ncbi:hypothetical protein [Streptomyces sp. NBC_01803]|uniref:hypothetical protein n=1 Tax=Streptomyces sp. NBC_01803 TaxID=2975946 RepID=UPI002DD90D28|nr:hypothetical protein [Streptomyces sp. NBC_01803]WSA45415.1 hypothetical protein OIE51_15100 [Streptomyces sp. NBC_01803]